MGDVTPVAANAGPATHSSPNTMELGLVASPFHSTRIQEEVQLLRRRPATLDQDGMALIRTRQDVGDVELYPDYESGGFATAMKGEDKDGATGSGIRVARVQTDEPESGSGPPQAVQTPLSERKASAHSVVGVEGPPMLNGQSRVVAREADAASSEERQSPGIALQGLAQEETKPSSGDARELVPVVPTRVEQLLVQMMEENRSLRRRLELMEAAPAWQARLTGTSVLEGGVSAAVSEGAVQSPVSFGPVGIFRKGGCA